MVTSYDLERSLSVRGKPTPEPHPPVGADPEDPFAPAKPDQSSRAHDRDARLLERVRRLEHELAEVRGELARADARVIELERAALDAGPVKGRSDAARKSSRERKSPAGRKRSTKTEASGDERSEGEADDMRQALTPLFRPEDKRSRKGGARRKPPDDDQA